MSVEFVEQGKSKALLLVEGSDRLYTGESLREVRQDRSPSHTVQPLQLPGHTNIIVQ